LFFHYIKCSLYIFTFIHCIRHFVQNLFLENKNFVPWYQRPVQLYTQCLISQHLHQAYDSYLGELLFLSNFSETVEKHLIYHVVLQGGKITWISMNNTNRIKNNTTINKSGVFVDLNLTCMSMQTKLISLSVESYFQTPIWKLCHSLKKNRMFNHI